MLCLIALNVTDEFNQYIVWCVLHETLLARCPPYEGKSADVGIGETLAGHIHC
jgi:hypothetical protein